MSGSRWHREGRIETCPLNRPTFASWPWSSRRRPIGALEEVDMDIVEVSPRDGLQSEDVILDTATKVELITRAVDAGIRRIEVCSFVNPQRVPQMGDAEAVMAALSRRDDVTYIGLVLNRRGFDRAV